MSNKLRNYQTDRRKHSRGFNIFKTGRNFTKTQTKSERLMEGIGVWTAFYRANPHRFVKEYLQLEDELKIFQQILLYAMMHNVYFAYIASRGQGKTYLTAIFAIVKAILFPDTQIVIAAGQKSQAKEIIDKIATMRNTSPNLMREISNISTAGIDPIIEFHNGSWIRTVAARDGARGKRSNLLIIDEYRMVPDVIVNTVLRKFQTASRRVGFTKQKWFKRLKNEDKKLFQERNQEMYLSSAWLKAHESWAKVEDYGKKMAMGRPYFVCQLPYQLAIKEGLLNEDGVKEEMEEVSFNHMMWYMEMEAKFWGSSVNSYFTMEEIMANRTLPKVYFPKSITELIHDKKLKIPIKEVGEIRIVSADIATMKGNSNDASVYSVARLIPSKEGYERQIVYMETLVGGHTQTQAIRIRELYEDYDADYIVLDTQSAGTGVYDNMTIEQVNPTTGEIYTPLSCLNDERLAERCSLASAPKVIYSVRGSAQLNSLIAATMKDSLRKGKIKFPIQEGDAIDTLRAIKGFDDLPSSLKDNLKLGYGQFTLMTTEFLQLESEISSDGIIKLTEPRSGRKDRYSSISYLNYFAHELEVKNRRVSQKSNDDLESFFMARPAKTY